MSDQQRSPDNDALLSLRDVSVTLRGQPVLRRIDLEIPRKQTLAIIGESGCGKTVTLKVMIGLLSPTRGEVRLDGKNLAKLDDRQLTRERARVGFLFQSAALFDSMTVGQNVAFPLRQQGGHSEEEIRQTVYDRLREVGLPKSVVTKRPAELSGGMRKRVGLARALAVKPELMFYDEPTTGLDPVMSDVINQLMIRTRERYEVTSVIVTHDMNTVHKVADRVVMLYPLAMLEEGAPQIIYDGPPGGLEQSPDKRVVQFVQGRADDRLLQLAEGAEHMDERVLQFRVGVMVVATVFIAGLLVTIFNYSPWLLRGRYVVYAKFVEAPGIEIDTPVRKSGVLIGRVTDVRLREQDVLIAMRIDSKFKVYQNEICRVGSQSLLGDPLIEFVAPPAGQPGPPLSDGALIEGHLQMQPLDGVGQALETVTALEDDVVSTLAEFRAAAQKVNTLADHLNVVAVNHEEEVSRVIQKTEAAMDNFNTAMLGLNTVVGDPQVQSDLKASVAGVPTMIAETQIAMEKFGAVADRVNTQLDTVQPFTESLNRLSTRFDETGPQVDAVLDEMEALARDLRVATAAINEQKGTIGKLVHSPELYQRLNYAAANIECVSGQLQPIVNDVRVFADKIARDPGRLGVKGALMRGESGTKFLPMSFFYGGDRPQSYSYHWSPTPTRESCEPTPQYERPPQYAAPMPQYAPAPTTVPQPAPMAVTPQAFWRAQ